LREKGYGGPHLILTTNYDDSLETAFTAAAEPFDVVTYSTESGRFVHRPHRDQPIVINRPNEYMGLLEGTRTVILKLRGSVDRAEPARDSYVVAEGDYLKLLSEDFRALFPVTLAARIRESHLLFLGQEVRSRLARILLSRLWENVTHAQTSWAVYPGMQSAETAFWGKHRIQAINVGFDEYVAGLSERLQALRSPADGDV
jgi:hypothetical protein